ncbi:enoyl-CoA hydratase/isomerase family protein (plasmid) [Mesorhizobium sp. B2-1-8]|uniref:enoyl-CoA hydratase/isomerase family protein n=1 Tax=Mesorhizobium sp. B2-1-8 TaxID=2589967 RepID=UPI001128D080|nr:enoyl-CoA hydratase/isomerase family protein [Mesorhizobium sp. B2-1-8]UCI22815.1 enoyl-CoA hydratase/isomerase family protein [Mesorhizobium sp. B2-1-8]
MTVSYAVKDGIAHIVLDNGKMNVLTPKMHKAFFDILERFELDREARVGLLYGAGYDQGRSFCAGDDIKNRYKPERTKQQEIEALLFLHQDEKEPTRPGWEEDVYRKRRYKPIVSAIGGYCLGAGFAYAMQHSDLRICDHSAKLGFPEVAFGAAGLSGVVRLMQQISHVDAAWIALTGEHICAGRAREMRLVNEVVSPEALMPRALEVCSMIAAHPPTSVRVEMEALEIGLEMNRHEAAHFGQRLFRLHRLNYQGYGSVEGFFADRKTDGKK